MCKGHDATPINLIYSMIKMKRKISGTSLFCTLGVLIKDKWVRIELQNLKKKKMGNFKINSIRFCAFYFLVPFVNHCH